MTNHLFEMLTQAKIILLAIDQKRRNVAMEANSTIIRAAIGNLINIFTHEHIGEPSRLGARPTARFMSKKFFEGWSENPTQSNLRSVGVYEHRTPVKVLESIILSAKNEHEVIETLRKHAFCAWVTHEENQRLNELKLKSTLPTTGDRYTVAGIELYPTGPVLYTRPKALRKKYPTDPA